MRQICSILLVIGITLTSSSQSWTAHTNGNDLYFIGGNAGIGTTAPVERLHVALGDLRLDNNQKLQWAAGGSYVVGSSGSDYVKLAAGLGGRLLFYTDGENERMRINSSGDVGIGTNNPRDRLEVEGSIIVEDVITSAATSRNEGFYPYRDKAYGMELHYQSSKWGVAVFARNDSDIRFGHYVANETQQDNLDTKMIVNSSGEVGIGTTDIPSGYKLAVNGKTITEEVKVELSGAWPDYVFEEDYNLATLESIEKFIKSEKHLPEIPSAAEMEENGVELGTMNMLLLKKIEELTLHTIQQSKEIQNLQSNNQELNNQLATYSLKLEALLNRIENLESN